MLQGAGRKTIAPELGISEGSVKTAIERLKMRLIDLRLLGEDTSNAALVAVARQLNVPPVGPKQEP